MSTYFIWLDYLILYIEYKIIAVDQHIIKLYLLWYERHIKDEYQTLYFRLTLYILFVHIQIVAEGKVLQCLRLAFKIS